MAKTKKKVTKVVSKLPEETQDFREQIQAGGYVKKGSRSEAIRRIKAQKKK